MEINVGERKRETKIKKKTKKTKRGRRERERISKLFFLKSKKIGDKGG